jgi:alcohol dehydrogenase (cytochrome c)
LLGGTTFALARGGEPDGAGQLGSGRAVYAQHCAMCHGADLAGGQFAQTLKGPEFLGKWGDRSLAELSGFLHASMPPANIGGLPEQDYASLTALIFAENGGELGSALPADPALMARIKLPAAPARSASNGLGGVSARHPVPPGPPIPDRFANYTPVDQAELSNPAAENWPTWRRSHLGLGYSPLDQIDTGNVASLRIAWAQSLPPGANMNEPLVRDGVLYVFGYGDSVHAFDAASGRSLWTYQHRLPQGAPLTSKKTLALWGDKLFTATSDNHLVALDARSGRPVWDVVISDEPGFRNPGGPLAADGVVMQGLTGRDPGGAFIAGFDAETGRRLWAFRTVAQPGDSGGDTWNGLPAEARSGGSVWTSGTYDPETGLALWGTAPTYDTKPLRDLVPGENNDALFTDSTLAFEPRTGKLVWYFQHMKNDQHDMDWAFERTIGTLRVDGQERRTVITGSKGGLFDALDAATGRYIKTVDMGLQDLVVAIDPVTGDKTVDPAKIPGRDKGSTFVCPHISGGRNWTPTSFNPDSGLLFVGARDLCMDMVPTEDRGFLSTGVNIQFAPPPGMTATTGSSRPWTWQRERCAGKSGGGRLLTSVSSPPRAVCCSPERRTGKSSPTIRPTATSCGAPGSAACPTPRRSPMRSMASSTSRSSPVTAIRRRAAFPT